MLKFAEKYFFILKKRKRRKKRKKKLWGDNTHFGVHHVLHRPTETK